MTTEVPTLLTRMRQAYFVAIGSAIAFAAAAMIQLPAGAQPAPRSSPSPLPSASPSPRATPGEIGHTSVRTGTAANQSITAQSSIDAANAVQTRGSAALENYVYDVPGMVYYHSGKSNLDHFKIRGADNEPRTEIDGHPITNTGAGNFLVGWMNAYAFDRIDVEKGPGISEGDEGRTAFGTINLITRGFTTTSQFDSVFGFDSQYGSTVSMVARGPLGRLQYVFADNFTGMGDPNHNASGLFFGPARTNLVNNAAVPLYSGSLAGGISLRNEIAKLRYTFSPVTTLDLGYIGFSGIAAPLGSSYAGYEGNFVTGASPTATITGTTGTVQPFYSGYTNGSERVNEPVFEAAFRTHIGSGTLAISPFTMQLSDLLAYAAPPVALSGFPSSKFTGDSQHGTTVSFTQPFSFGYVKLNYEYRSDATTVYTGTTFTPATLTTPTTTLHENDLSLTSQSNLTSRLSLGAGLFYDGYHNDGWIQPASSIAAGIASASVPFNRMTVISNHLDPHLGLVYRTGDATWLRAAFGSSVYGPGSTLISGRSTYTAPAPSNNNQGLITTVNPNLKPEVTVAYGLGLDRRLHDGTLLSVDLYDDTIHDKFLSFTATGSPVVVNNATVTPLVNQTINASLQRTYGAELSAHRIKPLGFGYDLALSLARQYYDQIPPAYFIYAGGPVSPFNGYNGTTYPYWTAHAEFRYAWPTFAVAFGEDTAGADNVQRAPGFTTMYVAGQIPVGKTSALQVSVANLFNYQTQAFSYGTGPTGSGASTITAYPAGGVIGAPLTYSQQLANVQGVAPRAYRLSLITHLGAH